MQVRLRATSARRHGQDGHVPPLEKGKIGKSVMLCLNKLSYRVTDRRVTTIYTATVKGSSVARAGAVAPNFIEGIHINGKGGNKFFRSLSSVLTPVRTPTTDVAKS